MKQAIALKLSAALRSNEYIQGRNYLRDRNSNRFCPLGIICNLHALAHPKLAAAQTNPGFYYGENKVLPKEVMVWAGMKSPVGQIKFLPTTLAMLNDTGVSFEHIADTVDKFWEHL